MSENPRIEDLRRRVQKDPASIAFAQLGEEYRRAGRYREAIETCRAGLARHPGYLSARVTLGRALIEIDEIDAAETELSVVLRTAPDNLAAIRGLAEIHHRRGDLREALEQYQTALDLARHDPDLEQMVDEIGRELAPPPPAKPAGADWLVPEKTPIPHTREFLADHPIVPPARVVEVPPARVAEVPPTRVVEVPPTRVVDAAPGRGADPQTSALIGRLERWLDAILADRQRRAAMQAQLP